MDKIIKIQDIDNYDDSSPLLGLYKLNKIILLMKN